MLQHIPRPNVPPSHMPNTPMQRSPLGIAIIDAPVQDIIIIKHRIPRLQLHHQLARHIPLISIRLPFPLRPRPPMRSWHHNERPIIIQRQIPLRMPRRLPQQPLLFLIHGRRRRDIVAMPPQRKVRARPYQQVVEFHDQIFLRAVVEKLRDGVDDGVVEVGCREQGLVRHVRVEEMLDPPDAVGGVGGPGGELLGKGAEVGPVAAFGERADGGAGGAEGGDLRCGEDAGEDDEALGVEEGFEVDGHGGC